MSKADQVEAILAGAAEVISAVEKEISEIVHESNDSGYIPEVVECLEKIVGRSSQLGGIAESSEGTRARRAIAEVLIRLINQLWRKSTGIYPILTISAVASVFSRRLERSYPRRASLEIRVSVSFTHTYYEYLSEEDGKVQVKIPEEILSDFEIIISGFDLQGEEFAKYERGKIYTFTVKIEELEPTALLLLHGYMLKATIIAE